MSIKKRLEFPYPGEYAMIRKTLQLLDGEQDECVWNRKENKKKYIEQQHKVLHA